MKETLLFPTIAVLVLSLSACTNTPINNDADSQDRSSSSAASGLAGDQKIGYVHRAYDQNGNHMIDFDFAEGFFTNQDAGKAIHEDNPDCAKDSLSATCQPPHGWYLRNKNTAVSTLPLSDQVQILMETLDPYKQQPGTKISFEDFGKLLDDSQRNFKSIPFWVTISNGTVLEIREQFIP